MKNHRAALLIFILIIGPSLSLNANVQRDPSLYHYGPIYSINIFDADGDSVNEVALGSERGIVIIEKDQTEITSFACDIVIGSAMCQGACAYNSIFKGDITGNGQDDIIFGAFDKFIYMYENSDLSSGPLSCYVWGEVLSSSVADYDGDGNLELLIGTTEGKVAAYGWDTDHLAKEVEADLSIDSDNYIFDILVEDVLGDTGLEIIVGAGYEDASGTHYGRAYLLDNALSEIWNVHYGEFVFDVEVMNGKVVCSSDEVAMIDPAAGNEEWDYFIGDYSFINITDDIYVGSQNERIYSLSSTGHLNWGPIDIGSAINSIYVNGNLIAVGADDLYLYNTDGAYQGMQATSKKVNQTVIVDDEVYAGTDDGSLYRFDLSLDPLWANPYHTKGKVIGLDVSSDLIVTGSRDGIFRTYDIDGNFMWQNDMGSNLKSVATSGDYVCFGDYDGNVYCYIAGIEEWHLDFGCQIRDMEIYDIHHDGSPNLIVGLGTSGTYNIYCLDLATGATEWRSEIGGWVYGIGCGDLDGNGLGDVIACSTSIHCLDHTGTELWTTDIGTFSNDAAIYEADDHSCAFVASVGTTGLITAINCNGDIFWQYAVQDEDIYSVCAGDIDGDNDYEVLAGGGNNVFMLNECGQLEETDYQFRDARVLRSLSMSDKYPTISAFLGAYGVEYFHADPRVKLELDMNLTNDAMQMYIETDQYLSDAPILAFEGTNYNVSIYDDGWLSEEIPLANGSFEITCTNILNCDTQLQCNIEKSIMSDSSSISTSKDEWDITLNTSSPVNGEIYYISTEDHPRLDPKRDLLGKVLTIAIDPVIEADIENIILSNSYNESEIPQGFPESLIGLYHWDDGKGEFIECDNYSVDVINNTITGTMTSNGTYLVLPKLNEITLQMDWNLMSFNYDPSNSSLDSIFADLTDNVEYIYRWNPSAQTYEYSHYNSYGPYPGWYGDFTEVDNEHGYWVYALDGPFYFDIEGDNVVPTTIDLLQDWNLICWPLEYEVAIEDALIDVIEHVDYVYRWNPVSRKYEYSHYTASGPFPGWYGDFDTFEPGKGYWLHSSQACSLNLG